MLQSEPISRKLDRTKRGQLSRNRRPRTVHDVASLSGRNMGCLGHSSALTLVVGCRSLLLVDRYITLLIYILYLSKCVCRQADYFENKHALPFDIDTAL